MQLRSFVVRGFLWAGAGKIISVGASFLLTVALARALSPEDYGQYFLALTTIVVLSSIGTLGADISVVRLLSNVGSNNGASTKHFIIGRCLAIVAAGAACSAYLFYLTGPLVGSLLSAPGLAKLTGILALWLFIATMQRQVAETFRGLGDIRQATILGGARSSGILYSITTSALVLLAWALDVLTLYLAVAITAAAATVVVVVGMYRLLADGSSQSARFDVHSSHSLHSLLLEGWPLWIATFVATLNFMGTAWLAAWFDTPDQVALFGAAQRFVLILIAPVVIINAVLPPIVASLHASGEVERLQRVIRTLSAVVTVPAFAVFAALAFFGGALLSAIFGDFYRDAYWVTVIICLSQVINIATGAWQIVLPMVGLRHQLLVVSISSIGVQLLVAMALGPSMGVLGVSVAFACSVLVGSGLGALLVRRYLGIWTFASINGLRWSEVVKTAAEIRDRRVASLAATETSS